MYLFEVFWIPRWHLRHRILEIKGILPKLKKSCWKLNVFFFGTNGCLLLRYRGVFFCGTEKRCCNYCILIVLVYHQHIHDKTCLLLLFAYDVFWCLLALLANPALISRFKGKETTMFRTFGGNMFPHRNRSPFAPSRKGCGDESQRHRGIPLGISLWSPDRGWLGREC